MCSNSQEDDDAYNDIHDKISDSQEDELDEVETRSMNNDTLHRSKKDEVQTKHLCCNSLRKQ